MRLLHFVLISGDRLPAFPAQWGEPPKVPHGLGKGVASALYSDVGANFYTKCGPGIGPQAGKRAWITRDALSTIWSASASPSDGQGDVEWIGNEELDDVWKADAELMKEETRSAGRPVEAKMAFCFLPHGGVARFLYERAKMFVPPSWKSNRWGARVPAALSGNKLEFVTWMLDPGRTGPSTLVITRLRADTETFPPLLNAVVTVARELELEQVEVWNLPTELKEVGERLGGVTRERKDHLPSLSWFGEGDVQWCWNEKFSWC